MLPLAAAVVLVGMSFGTVATTAGLPLGLVLVMSATLYAGGAQFLVIGVLAAGGNPLAALAGGLLLNARHLPFGLAVSGVFGGSLPRMLLGVHLMTDEAVAFTRDREVRDGPAAARLAYWTCGIVLLLAWNAGTLLGALAGGRIADPAVFGVDAAFPAGLLALVLPALTGAGNRDVRLVAGLGAVLAVASTPALPAGLPVLVAVIAVGVTLLPVPAVLRRAGSVR